MKKEILFYLLMSILIIGSTQNYKRGYNWYFGKNAALNFSSGTAVSISPSMLNSFEGSSCISDINGNLLFYTNGGGKCTIQNPNAIYGTVWDRNHNEMPNAFMKGEEGGGWSAGQSSIIIPKPGTTNVYCLFTMDEIEHRLFPTMMWANPRPGGNGMSYFEIDMTLNGGFGDVTVFNQNLVHPSEERIAGTIHGNGTDYWIVGARYDTINNHYREIYLYQVTAGGIMPPIKYTAQNNAAYMKFSPDATMFKAGLMLFDFNNNTGTLSNERYLTGISSVTAFSANSKYLYGMKSTSPFEVYQYDLSSGNGATIIASKITVGTLISQGSQMQLGPDGRIYIAHHDKTYLSAITCPNQAGIDCGVVSSYVTLSSGTSQHGLPVFIDAWFASNDTCGFPEEHLITADFLSSKNNICEGDVITFTDNSSGIIDNWDWDFDVTSQGGVFPAIANTQGPHNVTFNNAGSYTIKLVVSGTDGTDSISKSIIVSELPTAFAGGSVSICHGESATVSGATSHGGTILWTHNGSGSLANETTLTPTYTSVIGDAGNTVTLTMTVSNAGCGEATANYSIIVNNSPPVANANVDCSSGIGNAIITITSPIGIGYEYSLNGGTYQSSVYFGNLSNGMYTITVKDSNGCTSISENINVSCGCPFPPIVTLSSNSGIVCGILPISINENTFSNADTVYVTHNGTGNISSNIITMTPFSFTYTPSAGDAGNIIEITIITNNPFGDSCNPDTATYTLTVHTLPDAPLSGGNKAECAETPLQTLIATASVNTGENIVWYDAPISGNVVLNPILNTIGTVTYYAESVNDATSCTSINRTAVTLTIYPLPSINISSNSPLCQGENIELIASGGTIYQWTGPEGFESTNPNVIILNVDIINSGNYFLTVTDNNACSNDTTVSVIVNVNPELTIFPSDTSVCSSQTLDLVVSSNLTGTTFLWSTNETGSTITVIPSIPQTTYSVIGTTDAACTASAEVTAYVNESPVVTVSNQEESCINNKDGKIIITVTNGTAPYHYTVISGSGGTLLDSVSFSNSMQISNLSSGTYQITVEDINACSNEIVTTLNAPNTPCMMSVYVPNIFSPNGDGQNDVLYVRGEGISDIEFTVYSRWGQKIFHSNDINNGWDGRFKGKDVNPAVFAYYLKIVFLNGDSVVEHGNVSLIR